MTESLPLFHLSCKTFILMKFVFFILILLRTAFFIFILHFYCNFYCIFNALYHIDIAYIYTCIPGRKEIGHVYD